MPKVIKTCKVCGSQYEACHTLRNGSDLFRWQDVACSPECGSKYFNEILESREIKRESEPELIEESFDEQDEEEMNDDDWETA